MVRAPNKTCPNLCRLFDEAPPELIHAFLESKPFERLSWLEAYRFEQNYPEGPSTASNMLRQEKKDQLRPLETQAARIINIASERGEYVLEGLARTKLETERARELLNQRDQLARSLWAFVNEHGVFEAAENSLHMRLYRRYDRHYQTFMAEPSVAGGPDAGSAMLDELLSDLNERLDRGDGYSIDRFDIPEQGDEPAAEMYLLFHPDRPTSVREIDEEGNRTSLYFRPPGEAMIVYTPSTGRVHVRAKNRKLRHTIAERFIEEALDQTYSNQPVDFQAYDISRFLDGLDLELPEFDDVVVLRARVIRADISVGNLTNRLSLSTTIDQDISEIVESQPGLARIFERAVAIRFVEIAVRYRRGSKAKEETLDFTLTDRNTSSLLSLDDPLERVLGHRLLGFWEIVREGRAPGDAESMAVIPALLAIWDLGTDKVSGAWLLDRRVDPDLLTELGFLVPVGWEEVDLIEDENQFGPVDAGVVPHPDGVTLQPSDGQEAPGGCSARYRVYRVRDGWVFEHLREQVATALAFHNVLEINRNLLALGSLDVDGRPVPVYLARRLHDERACSSVDAELRARGDRGIGIVLQAGRLVGSCLAANVLTPLMNHIDARSQVMSISLDSLRATYRRDRSLARGGQTVELHHTGKHAGMLSVPGKGTIQVSGANRLLVIERLVRAHNNGPAPISTADLIKDIEGQSLANIFGQPLWDKLKADFLRSPKKSLWEIAI